MSSFSLLVTTLLAIYVTWAYADCYFTIQAVAETPIYDDKRDPDDAVVIINEQDKSESLIVGTLKKGGLDLYNLNGTLLQHISAPKRPNNSKRNKPGRFNNVDVIHSVTNTSKVIVIVTDRGLDQLRFYTLNADNLLQDITNTTVPYISARGEQTTNCLWFSCYKLWRYNDSFCK